MKTAQNSIYQDVFALIADESPNLVVITDKHQKIEWVNKTFIETCGYKKGEVLGKNPNMLQGEDTDRGTVNRIKKAIKSNELVNERILNYTKKGEPYWIELQVIPILNKEGEAVKFVSIGNNISEQVYVEEQLKKSEEKLHAILDSTIDSHYLLDHKLNILAFNKVAKEAIDSIWHSKLEQGNNIMEYLPQHYHKKFTRLFKMALVEDITSEVEVNLQYTPDYSIWYSLVFSPAYNKPGELLGVTLNATNIEQRKKAELLLIETNKKLAEIARIQSHELRKPLANIMGLSSIMQNQDTLPKAKELMEKMLQSTKQLDEVVRKIVNNSQADSILESN